MTQTMKKRDEEIKDLKNENMKLTKDLHLRIETHEEEVQLRQKVEARLNHLHSLNRHLEGTAHKSGMEVWELKRELDIIYTNFENS